MASCALNQTLQAARPDYGRPVVGRSLKDLLEMTLDFGKCGIRLVSIKDHIDTTTAQVRLIFNIFASLAEFERDLIRERTRSGLEAARARRLKNGYDGQNVIQRAEVRC